MGYILMCITSHLRLELGLRRARVWVMTKNWPGPAGAYKLQAESVIIYNMVATSKSDKMTQSNSIGMFQKVWLIGNV